MELSESTQSLVSSILPGGSRLHTQVIEMEPDELGWGKALTLNTCFAPVAMMFQM